MNMTIFKFQKKKSFSSLPKLKYYIGSESNRILIFKLLLVLNYADLLIYQLC